MIACELVVGRCTAQRVLELLVGLLDRACFGPHRPRHPVGGAQFVEDGAFDAGDGVGLELVATLGIELVDGVEQTENARAHEVVRIDVLSETGGDATTDVLDERRVTNDQAVASALSPVVL